MRFPNLIVAHADLQEASRSGEMKAPDFLETVVAAALVRVGVLSEELDGRRVPSMQYMKDELERQDRFMVLLLDEFEHAFKLEGLDPKADEKASLRATLCRHQLVERVSCLPACHSEEASTRTCARSSARLRRGTVGFPPLLPFRFLWCLLPHRPTAPTPVLIVQRRVGGACVPRTENQPTTWLTRFNDQQQQ